MFLVKVQIVCLIITPFCLNKVFVLEGGKDELLLG
jgi:hypothetical protein